MVERSFQRAIAWPGSRAASAANTTSVTSLFYRAAVCYSAPVQQPPAPPPSRSSPTKGFRPAPAVIGGEVSVLAAAMSPPQTAQDLPRDIWRSIVLRSLQAEGSAVLHWLHLSLVCKGWRALLQGADCRASPNSARDTLHAYQAACMAWRTPHVFVLCLPAWLILAFSPLGSCQSLGHRIVS